MKNLTPPLAFFVWILFASTSVSSLAATSENERKSQEKKETFFHFIERVALNDTIYGCTYPWALGFDPLATDDDGSCLEPFLGGNITAEFLDECSCLGDLNGDGAVNTADLIILLSVFGTFCPEEFPGCTDGEACNFNPDATLDDGTCEFETCAGCTDDLACNYNPSSTIDDGTCVFPEEGEECDYCDCDLDVVGPTFVLVPENQNELCEESAYSYALEDPCVDPSALEVVETRDTIYSDDCGNYEHLVTLTAEDPCGNQSTAQFTIVVQDTDSPYLFVGLFPSDTTISCDVTLPVPPIYEGYDNCDGFIPVFFNETAIDGECNGEYEVERTWLMQDCSGNQVEHVQSIFIIDDQLPVFVLAPEDQNNQCEEQPYFYEAVDNCNDVEITETREVLFEDSCGNYEHLVTLSASDLCGNFTDTTFTIIVQDTIEPVWITEEFPQDMTVSCDDLPAAPAFEAMDNCAGLIEAAFVEEVVNTDCPGQSIIVRTWIASDCTGNSISHVQTLTVEDDEAPGFVGDLPLDLVVECDAIPAAIVLVANDNCDDEVEVIFTEDLEDNDCLGSYTITRTWAVEDCAGNANTHVQTIDVQDTTAPAVMDAMDATVECDGADNVADLEAWLANNGGATATDACSGVTWSNDFDAMSDDCGATGSATVLFTATDDCGNAASTTATFTIEDTTAPVFTEVPNDQENQCEEAEYASAASDNCSEFAISESREVISDDECGNYEHLVTLTATDECGNSTDYQFTIIVQDTEAPAFAEALPASMDLVCSDGIPAAEELTAMDNCDGVVDVSFSEDVDSSDPCAFLITRTWSAVDCSGNGVEHVQILSIADDAAPEFTSLPEEFIVLEADENCFADLSPEALGIPEADDTCSGMTLTYEDNEADAECVGNLDFERTWIALDECGNSTSFVQFISVEDITAPVIVAGPEDFAVECDGAGNLDTVEDWLANHGGAMAEDNCSEVSWTNDFMGMDDACGATGTALVTFTATDDCGNETTASAMLSISDLSGPEMTTAAMDATVECDGAGNAGDLDAWLASNGGATATDACSGVTWSNDFDALSDDCGATGAATVTFTATDDCGNATSTTATFTIEDTTAPAVVDAMDATVECDGAGNAADLDAWLASNGGASATDACSGVTWSNDFDALSDDCGATGAATVMFTATDDCGNATSTTATFTIEDTTAPAVMDAMDATVECDGAGNAADLDAWLASNGGATATDACSGVTWSNDFDALSDDCGATGAATVMFTATDDCGNATSTTATFTIEDTTAPAVMDAMDATVECDGAGNGADLEAWLASNGGASATDACSGVTWSNDFDALSDDCGATGAATVTFTATDDCGNATSTMATFTIEDTTAPALIEPAVNFTSECAGEGNQDALNIWLETHGGAEAEDACSAITWTNNFQSLDTICGFAGSAEVTFVAMDDCGNETSTTAIFTIQDTTQPVYVEQPQNLTVECDGNGNEDDLANWLNNQGGAVVDDACGSISWEIITETIEEGCENGFAVTAIFIAIDDCGNASTSSAFFTVVDNTGPEFVTAPDDQISECEEVPYDYFAQDLCGTASVTETREVLFEDNCGNYEHLVTLTATDNCGNETIHEFTIQVQDTTPPTFVEGLPQDIGMTCFEAASEAEVLTAIDNCDVSVEVVFNQDSIPGDCPGTYTLLRNWTSIDCSGNEATHEQVVEVSDTEQPELIGLVCPEDATIFLDENCEVDISPEALGMPSVSAIDNCSEAAVVIEFEDAIDPQCGEAYNFTRTFSIYAVDACGLVSEVATCNQFIQVQDILSPTFTNAPEDLIFECEEEAFAVEAVDGCTAVSIDESREVISEDECGNYVHLVTLTASDDCGNVVSHIFTITVEDTESPIWDQAMPGDLNISCGELEDAGLYTATDVCDGAVDVDFAEEIIGEAGCAAGFTVIRTWTATDCTGNESVVTQEIVVSDSGAPEWSMEIPSDVTVECSAVPVPPILTAVDNCDDNVEVVLTEEIVEGPCPSRYTLIRTWTATDDCGNFIEGSQTLIVVDTTAPIWIGSLPAVDLTVTCLNIPEPPVLTGDNPELIAFDNCDGETTIIFNEYSSGSPCEGGGVIFRSWIAIDCIGNLATLTQTILVVD